MAQRPTFLSIICILLALYGVMLLLGGAALAVLGGTGVIGDVIGTIGYELTDTLIMGIGIAFVIVGVLALLVVFLLWNGNSFGWYLTMVFLVINAVSGIFMLPAGVVQLVITILLIWYFFRPNVKDFFGV